MEESFEKVYPKEYAEKLKNIFLEKPELWYQVITPKEKADYFKQKMKGDYSKFWHVHCELCWKNIDSATSELCYKSKDGLTWICGRCFNQMK